MITTITKLLNLPKVMLSTFTGVSCGEMPLVCEQCPNPKHTGWAAMGKHRHSSSSSKICKHKTLTKTRLHGGVSQAPGVWPGYSLHKKPKPDLGRPSGLTSGKKGMNHHGFVLVCKEPCWTAGPCDGTSRFPAGKAGGGGGGSYNYNVFKSNFPLRPLANEVGVHDCLNTWE